ncbi:putative membrane protein [Rhodococcus sp. MTM3W5.2]|uniref:hypothetical protein n=1 Tax=Rhodococcus sp. MTM3W5.2 TaxID=1805827 RepID=UPI0009798680|nr:hypothetical protein [Rhodococcus sp. MTM3W5.2]AQA22402.1 putative membrane protein [Rhodococcus sp. MTM3W5.2]
MLVLTLVMAAVGFALLVIALMTGSVVWAWGCIVVCVVGAVLLLVSSLRGNTAPDAAEPGAPPSGGRADASRESSDRRFDAGD